MFLHRRLGLEHCRGGTHIQQFLGSNHGPVPDRRSGTPRKGSRATKPKHLRDERHEGFGREHGDGQVEDGDVFTEEGDGLEDVAAFDGGALLECLDEVAILDT